MTNDPTITPNGQSGVAKTGRPRAASDRSSVPYPEMMGDETEEQNLNQIGDPSARIREDEVDEAFGAGATREARSFLNKEARDLADKAEKAEKAEKAKDAAAEKLSALTDKVNAMRDQMQQSADAARDWATKQAGAAKDAAVQLHTDKPVLVLSVSAGAALVVGLLAGFIVGRATADDY
jgi:ElaB/YqjD/DUF883 family membrane-anchored ribosome-binding protein